MTEQLIQVPFNPTEEQWSGLARHFCRYMQMYDRYTPKNLKKYLDRHVHKSDIPDWLNEEVPDWESGAAFATADLGVFIYKAMLKSYEEPKVETK